MSADQYLAWVRYDIHAYLSIIYLSIYLPIYLSLYLLSIYHLSIYHLSIYYLSIYLPIYLSIDYLSIYYLSIYLSIIYLSVDIITVLMALYPHHVIRKEADGLPGVARVSLDPTIAAYSRAQQTPYMPAVGDIPLCPEEFLPTPSWANEICFIFSKLRTVD